MPPDAPGLFSTTTGTLSRSVSFCVIARDTTSELPPGAETDTQAMGLSGQTPSAMVSPHRMATAPAAAAWIK
ncbi:hypothetical protein D3C71_2011830 [compost metagenome]